MRWLARECFAAGVFGISILTSGCAEEQASGSSEASASIGSSDSVGEAEDKDLTGQQQAERDIAAGKLLLRELPLPSPPGANEYSALLKQRGIRFDIRRKMTDIDREYNKFMRAEIERQFGKGILSRLKAEGKKNWEAKLAADRKAAAEKEAESKD